MGLREVAEADLEHILGNSSTGFGWPITLTAPDGTIAELTGNTKDIAQLVDPDTGVAVSGRLATISIRVLEFNEKFPGQELPRGTYDPDKKPWVVDFDDTRGESYKFTISESNPDRTLGVLTCILEAYE